MPDDCGCRHGGAQSDSISRREFIKTTGSVVAGAALAATPLRIGRPPGLPFAFVDADTTKLALSIATADAMYQELGAEIEALDMKVDASFESVKFADAMDSLVGIVIPHSFSPSKRMGADIAMTVDISSEILTSVQAVLGWSLVGMLDICNIALDYRDSIETIIGQNKNGSFSVEIRPRVENYWTFPYQNAPPSSPLDLVASGWPPHAEDPSKGYWHYASGTKAAWLAVNGEPVYRITQVKEMNNSFGDQFTDLPLIENQGG